MVEIKSIPSSSDESNFGNRSSINLRSGDIPVFVEVDVNVTKNEDDKKSCSIHLKRTVANGDALVHDDVSSADIDSTQSFVEVDDYSCQDILGSTRATYKPPSLSFNESFIDSSNIESVTLASDGRLSNFDSSEQMYLNRDLLPTNECNSPFLEREAKNDDTRNQANNKTPIDTPCGKGQSSTILSLEQEQIYEKREIKQKNSSNCDELLNTTSEVSVGQSCYVNVGKHLFDTGSTNSNIGPVSTPKLLGGKGSDSSPSSVDVAEYLFPDDCPKKVQTTIFSKVRNTLRLLSFMIIIPSVFVMHWYQSKDTFEVDKSVEEEPLTLDVDIAAKMEYHVSQHGTKISHQPYKIIICQGFVSQQEWLDFQNKPDVTIGRQILSFYLWVVINNLSLFNLLALFLCACLIVLQASLRSKLRIINAPVLKQNPPLPTTPFPVKRCKQELKSLEKVNIFGSTVDHEIIRNDGSRTKVKRSTRFVLSPEVRMSHRIKLERCLMENFNSECSKTALESEKRQKD